MRDCGRNGDERGVGEKRTLAYSHIDIATRKYQESMRDHSGKPASHRARLVVSTVTTLTN